MTAVLIVDDHMLLATAVQDALIRSGIPAAAVAPRPFPQLLASLLSRRPVVVMLNLDLGAFGDSTGLIGPLTDAGVRVVLVAGVDDPLRIARALEAGAVAFRGRSEGLDAVLTTVQRALADDRPQDAGLRVDLLEQLRRARASRSRAQAPFERLTEREQAALRALAEGMSVREIAAHWVVAEATVRSHVRAILTKLHTRSQLAAVVLALRSGWLDSGPTYELTA